MKHLHGIFLHHGEWENMAFSNRNMYSNGFSWIQISEEITRWSTIRVSNAINNYWFCCDQNEFDFEVTFEGTETNFNFFYKAQPSVPVPESCNRDVVINSNLLARSKPFFPVVVVHL